MRSITWALLAAILAGPFDPLSASAFAAESSKTTKARRVYQTAADLKPRFTAVAKGVGYWSGSLHTPAGPIRIGVLKVDPAFAEIVPAVARRPGGSFGLARTSALAARSGAVAAVNGSFFSPRDRQPMDLLVVDGHWLNEVLRRPALILREDGTASILAARRAKDSPVRHAVGGGPTLLADGKMSLAGWPRSIGGRAPRTAVGLTWDRKFLLVTIDGRSKTSKGATIREEARYMAALGARDAINLDGGGSSTMVVRGHVVNQPSDGVERLVNNALMVRARRAVAARPVPRRLPYSGFRVDRS